LCGSEAVREEALARDLKLCVREERRVLRPRTSYSIDTSSFADLHVTMTP
jgi:hypothetical protein